MRCSQYRQSTDSIRAAFIEALAGANTPHARVLVQRIHYAGDAEGLWYLRPEAMSVLASHKGEAHARDALVRISAMFIDILPEGLALPLRAVGKGPCAGPLRRDNFKEAA